MKELERSFLREKNMSTLQLYIDQFHQAKRGRIDHWHKASQD
jgi:hypothetical protein